MLYETNTEFQKFVINECLDFKKVCNNYNINLKCSKSGVCFCPFHYNKNTPSAKVYSTGLYCFSENKHFFISDLLEYELIDDTILNVFNNIWNLLNNEMRDNIIKKYENYSNGSLYKSINSCYLPLLDYKRNKINYDEYCKRLLNILKNNSEN